MNGRPLGLILDILLINDFQAFCAVTEFFIRGLSILLYVGMTNAITILRTVLISNSALKGV